MRINRAGEHYSSLKYSFKSVRTDKNAVNTLKNGTKPIGENQRLNILSSINNLANNPDRPNIEFLLGVADNLVYGQNGQSKFRDAIDEDGQTPANRENTDWSKILEDTILQAINVADETEDVSDLHAEYERVFGTKKELTPDQEKVLLLRSMFNSQVADKAVIENEDDILQAARIKKNMDYFVASSEIPISQKKECLDKFIYLLSDAYKINPQLKDKKLQVVDEMLNDMLIKTPEDDVLTIKDVDQRITGICAAISICRKAVAYEDKVQYMNIVMSELDDSRTMEVFDITDLESGKKVTVAKADIDYDSALAKGYRIIDASAHMWMQNAHASGNGTILTESYTAFDDETYNVFDDASWYEGLDVAYSPSKQLLKALIKEREILKSIETRRKSYKQVSDTINSTKDKLIAEQGRVMTSLTQTLSGVFAGSEIASSSKINALAKNIIKFYKGSSADNEVNVPEKLSSDVKAQIVADFIKKQNPEITPEQEEKLNTSSKKILDLTSDYVDYDAQITKAKNFNTNRSKYRYYRNLFQAAAAHRLAIEADVNMPDGIIRYERNSNIPPKDTRVLEYMSSLKNSFSSDNMRAKFKGLDGIVPSKEALEAEITEDMVAIETTIPQTMNLVLNNLFGKDLAGMLSDTIKNVAALIDNGDQEMLSRFSDVLQTKKDKPVVMNELKKWSDKLENSPSSKDVQDAVRILGFEDRMHAGNIFVSSFYNSLRQGISQEQYEQLVERFGKDNLSSALEINRLQFSDISDKYEEIMEKWAVPSSRTLILDKMEQTNSVLSRQKLDKLKAKFDKISAQMIENDKIKDLKARRKANEKACQFAGDDIDIFTQIEKQLPMMKKYSKNTYKDVNSYMFDALENQYSYIGMLNGQFWVREEGSSGLSSNEQIRIIEQMTGKPHHIEYDVNDAVKQIKQGKGSGILSTSVDDKDYAFHAQYIPAVTSEVFVNPQTKEKVVQDVLWTDNSWGRSEKESFWDGHNGHYYTDYDRGFGWKDGFILDKSFRIGLPVKDMHCAVGYAGKEKDKFGLFGDIVLPGTPTDTYQKLYKMFNNIFEMNEGNNFVTALEQAIDSGHKLDVDFLIGIDDMAEAHSTKLEKRLEKEIKSEEDFNKLADDDELKLTFEKIALYFATSNPMLRNSVYGATTPQDIADIKDEMFEEHLDTFASFMCKSDSNIESVYAATSKDFKFLYQSLDEKFGVKLSQEDIDAAQKSIFFDESEIKKHDGTIRGLEKYFASRVSSTAKEIIKNKDAAAYFEQQANQLISKTIDEGIKIKSLDSPILANSPLSGEFIAAIDKYLKPESDIELLMLLQGFQEAGYELAESFMDALEPEDVGLNYKPAYDYVKKYQLYDSNVARAFSEIVGTGFIYQQLPEGENTPEDIYRNLHVKLADMDVQKYVKKFKAEAFAKYKLRQAFPQPVVFSNDEIAESVNRMLKTYTEEVYSIKGNYYVLELLDKKDKFAEKYADSELYNSLLSGDTIFIEENQDELESLLNDLTLMRDFVGMDSSLETLYKAYAAAVSAIENADGILLGSDIAPALNKISSTYAEWATSSANETKFTQNIKEEQARLRNNIRVFVTSTIEPKYRDEATRRINEIITLIRKGAPQEEIDWLSEDLTGFVIARHITKNPTVLLKETVKCLQEGKKESEEYQVLKNYLLTTLKVAQQTKVQYKLVQNQHEGISAKTKDMLPMFCVTMTDGTQYPMASSQGMLYLVEQLRNQGDNNVTLNLFLEQSGLTEDALNSLIDNFELDKSIKLVDNDAKLVKDSIRDLTYIGNLLNGYFEKSRIKYKSFEDAFEQISNYVKRKTRHNAESPMVKNFLAYMAQVQVKETDIPVNSQMFKDVVASVTNSALEYLSDNINYKIEFVEHIPELLKDRAELLYAIKVPENSEANKRREAFSQEYAQAIAFMEQAVTSIYEEVTKSKVQPVDDGV